MVIRSSFRDYYDSALAYGHDPLRVYERETEALEMLVRLWPLGDEWLRRIGYLPNFDCEGYRLKSGLLMVALSKP